MDLPRSLGLSSSQADSLTALGIRLCQWGRITVISKFSALTIAFLAF